MFRTSIVLRVIVAGSRQFGAMAPKKVADASAVRERTRADQGRCGNFKRVVPLCRPIPFALREVQKTVKKKKVPGRGACG